MNRFVALHSSAVGSIPFASASTPTSRPNPLTDGIILSRRRVRLWKTLSLFDIVKKQFKGLVTVRDLIGQCFRKAPETEPEDQDLTGYQFL
jgi:hypothetical protein